MSTLIKVVSTLMRATSWHIEALSRLTALAILNIKPWRLNKTLNSQY